MNKVLAHLRGNVVAYLALFVALGGTSYAAISIPRNSVGTRQLRNGAVTAAKLAKGVGGVATIRAWARISGTGSVIASSEPATVGGWGGTFPAIRFAHPWPVDCFANATTQGTGGQGIGFVVAGAALQNGVVTLASVAQDGAPLELPIEVLVLCPT